MKTVSKLFSTLLVVAMLVTSLCAPPNVSAQFLTNPYTPEMNEFLPTGVCMDFTGEYQIHLTHFDNFPWRSGEVRYKYEVVSFPFIPDGTIIGETNTDRRLVSARSDTYGYNSTNPPCEGWAWENYNDAINGLYDVSRNIMHYSEGDMLGYEGSCNFPGGGSKSVTPKHQLASIYFIFDGQIPDAGCNTDVTNEHGIVLPHTIIKHTIYFKPSSCAIEDSISWLYDNTRGRMKSYPFTNNSTFAGGKGPYDVQFRPMILLKDEDNEVCAYNHQCIEPWGHEIDVDSNEPWIGNIIPGGTINYVEAPINIAACPLYYPTGQNNLYSPLEFYHLPPYALVHAPLLNHNGTLNAGYDIVSNNMEELFHQYQSHPTPQQHHYVIEHPFDVTILNSSEKIVYNPSEVEIDLINSQSEQVFPTGYKFLTVHGTFPSRNAYADAEASGMYPNLVDYPAPSTLGTQSSIYRVKSGSTLRIEPCVLIMDAVIEVEDGATLIYCPEYTFGNYSISFVNSTDVVEFCPENMAHCAMKCKQLNIYDYPGELIVDNNEVWDSSINPNSTLSFANAIRVQSGNTLTLEEGLELRFGPNGKIVVEAGAKLIIDGAYLGSACDEMWKGIEVLGNPNLNQINSANQGEVRIMNGGTIEHALVGVSLGILNANGTPNLSTTGGFVRGFSGATFLNCKQAVRAFDYQSPNGAPNRTAFENSMFEISEALPNDLLPGYQVFLKGVHGVKIANSTFINSRTDDFPILDAGTAIAATNSGFRVLSSSFENLKLGIRVKSLGFDDIKISQSTFVGNLGGVSLSYSGLAEVVENTFVVSDPSNLTWPTGMSATEPYGLYLGGSTGYEVEENLFYSSNIHKNVGVAIRNSGNNFNRIGFNNQFHTLEAGALVMGDNRYDPAEGSSQATGLIFRCNDFGVEVEPEVYIDLNYSIALTNEGEVSMHQGVITAEVPGAGNRFYPLCQPASTDREFYVDETTPVLSYVNYIPFAQPETRPDCNTGLPYMGVTASIIPFNKDVHCPSDLSSGGILVEFRERYYQNKSIYSTLLEVYKDTVNGGDTQFLLDLIEDEFVSSFELRNELLLASPRVTDRVLIAAIERDPTMNPWHIAQVLLANSPLPQNVLTALYRTDFDDYYKELVEDGQNGGISNTLIMESELSYFDGLKETARLDFVRQAFRQDSTLALNDSIIHYLSQDADDEQLKLLLAYHLKRGQYQQAEAILAQAPNLRWTSDFIDVISVVVNALKDTISAESVIRANEITLLAVANEHSPEAYLAQSLLEIYGEVEFDEVIVMPGVQPRSMQTISQNKARKNKALASVHPNPTRDMAYLNWRLPEGLPAHEVSIAVYNIHGQRLLVDFLNAEVGIREINTTNWSPGLYLFQLRHHERLIESIRFEVIR